MTPDTAATKDNAAIAAFHVHVYYDPAPHPRAMFQVAFGSELSAVLVPWLMLNREGRAPAPGD